MSAAQQSGGELPQDERATFDEWWAEFEAAHPDWRYADAYAMRWNVWQARAALAQRAASVPAQAGQPNISSDLDLIKHCANKALKWLDCAEFFDAEKYPTLPNGRIYDAAENLGSICAIVSRMQEAFATPAPAASVQPFVPAGYANETEFLRQQLKDSRTANKAAQLVIAKLQAQQLDIGRDAALEEAANKATSFLVGDPAKGVPLKSPTPHQIAAAIRALATQAAPEVASVPDAGDEPVYWSVTYRGGHNANAFPTKGLAQATLDRLNAKHPGEPREIVPLYTRPQPAPAVLSDEQVRDITLAAATCEALGIGTCGATLRAVLAAAAK